MNEETDLKILRENDLEDKICVVIGTRPGIIMFSPIIRELEKRDLDFFVIHTGQHYSYNMDQTFFEDLNLPDPEYKLDTVKECNFHGEQTAEMLKGCEEALLKEKPKVTLVGGDANTNLAGALAARKLRINVGHMEAGERSNDWQMPEEQNRVLIDNLSNYLFVTNEKGKEHLVEENIKGKIFITGNPIVDALNQNIEIAKKKSKILDEYELESKDYILLTLHREENVDSKNHLKDILEGLELVDKELNKRIIFLAHPRTQKRLKEFKLEERADKIDRLEVKDAVGYLDFIKLLSNTKLVLTDSGGVQQESCILRIPCVTLRENTEWTETIQIGANNLAGTNPREILESSQEMINSEVKEKSPFGDGNSAKKIIDILEKTL